MDFLGLGGSNPTVRSVMDTRAFPQCYTCLYLHGPVFFLDFFFLGGGGGWGGVSLFPSYPLLIKYPICQECDLNYLTFFFLDV